LDSVAVCDRLKKAGTMSGYKPEKPEKTKLVNATLLSMI
jgi:hypothetical protein